MLISGHRKDTFFFSSLLAKTYPLVLSFIRNVFPCPHVHQGPGQDSLKPYTEIFSSPNPDCQTSYQMGFKFSG